MDPSTWLGDLSIEPQMHSEGHSRLPQALRAFCMGPRSGGAAVIVENFVDKAARVSEGVSEITGTLLRSSLSGNLTICAKPPF